MSTDGWVRLLQVARGCKAARCRQNVAGPGGGLSHLGLSSHQFFALSIKLERLPGLLLGNFEDVVAHEMLLHERIQKRHDLYIVDSIEVQNCVGGVHTELKLLT